MAQKYSKMLAIETSCDETAAAVVLFSHGKIKPLSSIVASQIKMHQKTHGVVPEVAARAHLAKINAVIVEALSKAGTKLQDITYIAVTYGPGLVPSLLVGTEYAKALAFAGNKKLIPTNHLLGHLYSPLVYTRGVKLPSINLIVSGGHTYLVFLKNKKDYKIIGQTVDDAAGEAFDKVARIIGLKYPGGPEISKAALRGKKDYAFPRPMLTAKNFDFSFSGLKTAVLYKVRDAKLNVQNSQTQADIAMSFENAAVEVLVKKTIAAAKKFKVKSITISGGVAANKRLRAEMQRAAKKFGHSGKIKVHVPPLELCTDNALIIANAAAIKLQNGFKPAKKITGLRVDPVLGLK